MTISMGVQTNMATDDALPFNTASQPFEFQRETLRKNGQILDTSGIRGTRSHHVSRTRTGPYGVSGSIVINPSPLDLDIWLPRILGAAEGASDVFDLAETLPEFFVLIDRVASFGTGAGFQYENCKINRGILRGTQGGFVELELDIIGKVETPNIAFPSLTLGSASADAPYVFTDATVTLQSSAREFSDFELVVDNQLVADHRNSLTATDIDAQDRIVTLRMNVPWIAGSATDLYEQALAGAAGTFKLTNGNLSSTWTLPALQVPDRSPNVGGKGPINYNLEMTARRTAASAELSVTNDSTA